MKGRRSTVRGMTLVELAVVLALVALLMAAGAPMMADLATNARLREAGHLLLGEALMAQSEAVKRNTPVRLRTLTTGAVELHDMSDAADPVLLRERSLPAGVTVPAASFTYRGDGRLSTTATVAIDLDLASGNCSATLRCPGLRVDAGGPARLCADRLDNCS